MMNRCSHAFIAASWWSKKPPRDWGMPANDNLESEKRLGDALLDALQGFTPTGGKR
jgi:hypothetical protein